MSSLPCRETRETIESSVADPWRETLFVAMLRRIRLRGSFYFKSEFRAPWGVSIADHGTVFHIVAEGQCSFKLNSNAKPIALSVGDLVVVTRGEAHTLRDDPATPVIKFFDLVESHARAEDGVIRAGGKGPIATVVCGALQFESGATDPLLAVLPPVLHVKATEHGGPSWLRPMVDHVMSELDVGGAVAAEVGTRLADILFIKAVHWYFEQNADTAEFGWLAAVRDQQIGRALALLHARPTQRWTIASLAHNVALSRSAFADKFTELIGEPPHRYLTRIRINAAARYLSSSHEKLNAVAAAAGYESLPAFARTFRRHMGMTPGQYRAENHV